MPACGSRSRTCHMTQSEHPTFPTATGGSGGGSRTKSNLKLSMRCFTRQIALGPAKRPQISPRPLAYTPARGRALRAYHARTALLRHDSTLKIVNLERTDMP